MLPFLFRFSFVDKRPIFVIFNNVTNDNYLIIFIYSQKSDTSTSFLAFLTMGKQFADTKYYITIDKIELNILSQHKKKSEMKKKITNDMENSFAKDL